MCTLPEPLLVVYYNIKCNCSTTAKKIMKSILVSDSLDGYRSIIRAEPTVARTTLMFDDGDEVLYCIVENLVSIIIL